MLLRRLNIIRNVALLKLMPDDNLVQMKRDPTQRSTGNAGRGAASRAAAGPVPPLATPPVPPAPAAAPANIGVPFDPRAGVPYMPPHGEPIGAGAAAAAAAAAQPFDPRRGARPPDTAVTAAPQPGDSAHPLNS